MRGKLAPALRRLGPIGLGVGSFEIGWKIGEGVNAKFLRIGVPEASGAGSQQMEEIAFKPTGSTAGLWNTGPLPEDGWYWSHTAPPAYSRQRTTEYLTDTAGQCFAATPPAGFRVHRFTMTTPSCANVVGGRAVAYIGEDDLPAPGPIERYSNQPFTRSWPAPTAPTVPEVEQLIEVEIEKPENELLRRWLNHNLGSPGEEDPLTGVVPHCRTLTPTQCEQQLRSVGFENFRSVERADPEFAVAPTHVVATDPPPGERRDLGTEVVIVKNPNDLYAREDFSTRDDCDVSPRSDPVAPDPFAVTDDFYSIDGRVEQYWPVGAEPDPNPAKPVKLRQGTRWWGHKHIAAKHGWGPTERTNVQASFLAADYAPETDPPTSPLPNPRPLDGGVWATTFLGRAGRPTARR